MLFCLRVELLVGLCHVLQEGCRSKVGSVLVGQPLELVAILRSSNAIDVPERSSGERREAHTKDGSHVAIGGIADDAILLPDWCSVLLLKQVHQKHSRVSYLKAKDGLVDKPSTDAERDLGIVILGRLEERSHGLNSSRVLLGGLLGSKHSSNTRGLLARGVGQEARSKTFSLEASGLDGLDGSYIGRSNSDAKVRTQILVQVHGNLNSNLVGKDHGSNGHAEGLHGLVELHVVVDLESQSHALIDVGAKAPVNVESRHILADHGHLALLQGQLHGSGGNNGVGACVGDDLNELHLRHRREVMHAHDVLRALGILGDLADGEG
mmetsp:Transcript_15526/g.24160  ORF Transcript_15526/g.24160 Transcript_15526/m.24160 type:complete len:323 (+) Transcript_15526:47-1015(+)